MMFEVDDIENKEMVQNLLELGKVSVTYNKKGIEKSIICTLNKNLIPADRIKINFEEKKEMYDQSIQVVWDTEKQKWRSFTWDSVIEISI
jgi:hypothetical protein